MPSWNPDVPGPFDRCLRCFHPYGNRVAYCTRCGKIGTVFDVPRTATGVCQAHKAKAVGYCCLCARRVCQDCVERSHFSFAAGFRDLYYCTRCMNRAKDLEQRFFRTLEETGECAKHPGTSAVFACSSCNLPLCAECAYFFIKPLSIRRVDAEAYCLACFRSERIARHSKGGIHRWIRWVSGDRL